MGQFTYASVAAQQSIVMVNTGGPVAIQNLNHHVVMMLWGRMRGLKLQKARKDEMKNRKARLLIAKPGQLIRISNRLVVRYRYLGFREWSSIRFYGVWRNRSAAQNRWKNHGM